VVLVKDASKGSHDDRACKSDWHPEGNAAAAVVVAAHRPACEEDDDDEEEGRDKGEEADQNGSDITKSLVTVACTGLLGTEGLECLNSMNTHRNEDDEDDEVNEDHDLVRATEMELGLLRAAGAPALRHGFHFIWR
jgi:hypothetical protein